MKTARNLLVGLFLATSVFAQGEDSDRFYYFNECSEVLRNIDSQKQSKTGPDGITVTCELLPQDQLIAVALVIKNPNYELLNVRSSDIRMYNKNKEFYKLDANGAVTVMYKWRDGDLTSNETSYLMRTETQHWPGETSEQDLMYGTVFNFTETAAPRVFGILYYEAYYRGLSDLTVEVDVSNEVYKFNFGGGRQ